MEQDVTVQACPLTAAVFAYYDSGDERHLGPVLDKLRQSLTSYSFRRLFVSCPDKRNDLVQDSLALLLTLFRKRRYNPAGAEQGETLGAGALLAWAYRIHLRTAVHTIKKQNPSEPGYDEDPFMLLTVAESDSIDEPEYGISHEQASHVLAEVTKAVLRLPLGQRSSIILTYFHGLTQTQAAEVLGITRELVHRHVEKGMGALRRWAINNPQLRPTPELYAALSGVNTGGLFREPKKPALEMAA
ncbi:RNA polymerase sigma factor [Hymenobacter fodinae]|uniref:RNA polymerase sigma factor n=1 Tax=Hymenobacter fodinae TaxID=2510796 RepID=A0A4Z0P9B3_9BACT|nr:RNA polymerase sigma factor [Hymenobacter fodinae]TGE08769.1 RNA polymerase sigma factor [Hymenobacter fodinae]